MKLSKGSKYMILFTLFYTLVGFGIKHISYIPAIEITFFRSLVSFVISYSVLCYQKVPVWGVNHGLLTIRGVASVLGLVLFYTTLQRIPLASAVTIHNTTPIFTAVLSMFIVKEKIHPWQWFFFLISFTGVVLINSFDPGTSYFYLVIGLGGAFFSGLAYNVVRKINHQEHPLVIMLYFPLVAIPVLGVYLLNHWVMPQGWDWLYLLLIGVFSQFAQYFLTKAYQTASVADVSAIYHLGVVYALFVGWIFFGEVFHIIALLGIVLVFVGVFFAILYKQKQCNNSSCVGKE